MIKSTSIKYLFALLGFIATQLWSQNREGLTGLRDSSYTTASAFAKDVQKHPEIRIVQEFEFDVVETTRNITYCRLGERELKLDVFKNTRKKGSSKTAIIIIHGGGWRSGNRTQHYPVAQKLADLGYICFTPEYRLSTEALFPAGVYDTKAAIRWVRSHAAEYSIDPNRIVVLGFSAGGELAAFMGTTANMPLFEGTGCSIDASSTVNAVIDMDGTLSFVHPDSGEGDDSRGTSAATYWFGYSKKGNPILWKAASPLSYVGPETPPTLFLNSSVERMHAGRDDYLEILKSNHTYSEVQEFEGSPHSFILYHPWFEPTIKYIDMFLTKVFEN